jgi:ammonium transporter, Amt family
VAASLHKDVEGALLDEYVVTNGMARNTEVKMLQKLLQFRRPLTIMSGAGLALAFVATASAQTPDENTANIEDLIAALDTFWLLFAAFVVFFMQAGFALVEAGFVRSKNTINIMMKNILDGCVGAISFWAVGWAFAYGVDGDGEAGGFIGWGNFFLHDFDDYASWIFQFAFAATAATIVSGAMAERTRFQAYLFYSIFISAIIYPVVVHWVWDGNGWLTAFTDDPIGTNGYLDFAGSGVVHMVGGFAGLMGAIIVGPRLGKYSSDGRINPIPGHNISIAVLGMFILWFGWFGFNPGSTLGLSGGFYLLAAKVAVNTALAAAAGAATMVILSKIRTGKYDIGLTINGVLGGLVGITAGCAVVDPWAAIVIGAIAAFVVLIGVEALDRLHIDDPVGAVSVHGFAGVWGVLAIGLFATQQGVLDHAGIESDVYGLFMGGGIEQLGIQALGAASIMLWTMATAGILFLVIKYTIGLRVSPEEELRGLDIDEHGNEAYPYFERSPESGTMFVGESSGGGGGA